MKVKQPGYIIARPASNGSTHFFWRMSKPYDETELLIKEHVIEFEAPDNFDYTSEKVKALCRQRSEIQRNFDNAMEEINKQIDAVMGVVQESEL